MRFWLRKFKLKEKYAQIVLKVEPHLKRWGFGFMRWIRAETNFAVLLGSLIGISVVSFFREPLYKEYNNFWSWLYQAASGSGSVTLLNGAISFFLIFLSIIFLSKTLFRKTGLDKWFENNQGLLTMLGLFLSVIIFLFGHSVEKVGILTEELNIFIKNETSLRQDDNLNERAVRGLIDDMNRDANVIYWSDFPIDNYRTLAEHIKKYYADDCISNYQQLGGIISTLNRINEAKRKILFVNSEEELIENERLRINLLEFASSTAPLVTKAVRECIGHKKNVFLPEWYQLPEGIQFTVATSSHE